MRWSGAWPILPCLQEETGQEVLQAGSPGWRLKALRADVVPAPPPVWGNHHQAGAPSAVPGLSVTAICCISVWPPLLSPIMPTLARSFPPSPRVKLAHKTPGGSPAHPSPRLPSGWFWSSLHPPGSPPRPAHGPAALSEGPGYSTLYFRSQLQLPVLKAAAPQLCAGAPMRTLLLTTSRRIFHYRM